MTQLDRLERILDEVNECCLDQEDLDYKERLLQMIKRQRDEEDE